MVPCGSDAIMTVARAIAVSERPAQATAQERKDAWFTLMEDRMESMARPMDIFNMTHDIELSALETYKSKEPNS